jgi:UDPglucose 6-dehydrogenase
MRIVVVGTGYVGLVSGACFADFGHHVTCVDRDDAKIAALLSGEKTARDYDAPPRIVEAVNSVNDTRKRAMARKVAAPFGGNLRGKTIGVLGLTFKPNTDDIRDAPSIPLITALKDMGATVRAFDLMGMELARIEMPGIHYSENPYECAAGADALVIVTEWEQFRALDLDRLKREMACPVVVDLRNIYDPNELTKRGFRYQSIGRPAKSAA